MDIPLSILDLTYIEAGSNSVQTLQNTLHQARLADQLGYTRYWLSEHHNSAHMASASPEILIGHIAQITERIRVGAGGMMLPNHQPLKLAELFRLLEALHPGRIDLGIGRSTGTDLPTSLALRSMKTTSNTDDMSAELASLFTFAGEGHALSVDPQFQPIQAMPIGVQLPPVWILGSSDHGARVAAMQGLGFAFAGHLKPTLAISAIQLYRKLFKPSPRLQKPQVIITCSVVCAETDEQVEEIVTTICLQQILFINGHPARSLTPLEVQTYPYTPEERASMEQIRTRITAGRPEAVHTKLLNLIEQTGADELMIFTATNGYKNRARMLKLLADAFHLQR